MAKGRLTYFNNPACQSYIYISHLDVNSEDEKFLWLPTEPDSIQDSMTSTFGTTTALSRSAPIYTYSNSGPRSVQITLTLHRDMMDDANIGKSNITPEDGDDYVETLIKCLQAIALPRYNLNNKYVEPPLIGIRLANQIFIKGVVNGGVSVTYNKPLFANGKYAKVSISFNIYETDPYDSTTVQKNGSFRGLTKTLKDGFKLES